MVHGFSISNFLACSLISLSIEPRLGICGFSFAGLWNWYCFARAKTYCTGSRPDPERAKPKQKWGSNIKHDSIGLQFLIQADITLKHVCEFLGIGCQLETLHPNSMLLNRFEIWSVYCENSNSVPAIQADTSSVDLRALSRSCSLGLILKKNFPLLLSTEEFLSWPTIRKLIWIWKCSK